MNCLLYTSTGLSEEQKENTNAYLIENNKEGYRTCYVEVPVAEEDSSTVIPMASGSKSDSKNYARINAYATLYYNTYKKANTGYKPTKVGGRISYLPNSAQITSLSAQAFAIGAYLTDTGGSGFQTSQIASGKKTLDVNKFSPVSYTHLKTALAESIAKALGRKLIVWSIKSTTKAQDGLYQYDVVRRLYDSELGNEGVDDVSRYIKMGKIGEAFCADEQCVLLIDEIDKADLEFPNDLLWELDRMEFYIPETDETIKAKHSPIVIITSNAEKELPDAFLRRCAFHFIEFPDEKLMRDIILAHYPDIETELMDQVLDADVYKRQG